VSPGERRLTSDGILAAATALVDTDGLSELTMRRLGSALGVEAMSLYRYFPSRRALLDGLVENFVLQTATDPELQFSADDDWSDYLHRLAHGIRQMALTHPRLFPLVATHPTEAPWIRPPMRSLSWIEKFLVGLSDHDFPPVAAVTIYKRFSTFLLGHLLLEIAGLGLEQVGASAPRRAADPDRAVAMSDRRVDAREAEELMPQGPSAAEILDAADGDIRTTADEPVIAAAEPAIHAVAQQAGIDAAREDVGIVTDADVPIAAAVVSTKQFDLAGFPQVRVLAGLLAEDTSGRDFDAALDALVREFQKFRR
jgi:AcrR family transcriptional regulator